MPDPVHIASWLAVLFFIAAGVNAVMKLSDRWRGQPPPEQLKLNHDEVARRVEQLEHHERDAASRRRAMYEKIEAGEKRIQHEVRSDMSGLHSDINKLRESVASLTQDNVNQNRHLTHIEAKLDRLIERT